MEPKLGSIVIYTTREGHEVPAIISGLVDDDSGAVHLTLFPPPTIARDVLNYQFGTEQGEGPGTWHWPEPSE